MDSWLNNVERKADIECSPTSVLEALLVYNPLTLDNRERMLTLVC